MGRAAARPGQLHLRFSPAFARGRRRANEAHGLGPTKDTVLGFLRPPHRTPFHVRAVSAADWPGPLVPMVSLFLLKMRTLAQSLAVGSLHCEDTATKLLKMASRVDVSQPPCATTPTRPCSRHCAWSVGWWSRRRASFQGEGTVTRWPPAGVQIKSLVLVPNPGFSDHNGNQEGPGSLGYRPEYQGGSTHCITFWGSYTLSWGLC